MQPDQFPPQRFRQHLRDLGLADTGLALEKQRPFQLQRQMQGRGKRRVGDILPFCKQGQRVGHGSGKRNGHELVRIIDR